MKRILSIAFFLFISLHSFSQDIKLFDSYLRATDVATRYVVVLEDNSIWWFAPNNDWKESSKIGLPDKDIKLISCYSHINGSSRYVVVLEDNTIWWFAPGDNWTQSATNGLPGGYNIISFKAYSKTDGTRYTAVLSDNSIWWFSPGESWKKSSMAGLPQ